MTFNELEFNQAYKDITLKIRQKETKIAYIIVLILVPAGFTLDYIYYQDFYTVLAKIRALCVILLLILFALTLYPRKNKYLHITSFTWALVINAAICLMIYYTEGVISPYYAGLNLVIVGAAFMSLTLAEALTILFTTIILYILAAYLHNPITFFQEYRSLFNNMFFILGTGIMGATASVVREKQRFTEFKLSYELDERNKQLAELDQIKTDFFANISHELRTPLTLILSPLEDLLQSDQPFDFKVNKLLTTARDNGYRLLKLVNDILSIVRLDERGKKLECTPVDINPLLRSIVNSMQHLAEKQKITLHIKSDFTPIIINGNVSALEKIFINLINNAIKFTPENGDILINDIIDSKGVTITIADTGIGISKENLPHIFDRFQQADSSATRKYQGTGLGLALVRELTLALKGSIDVDSQLDRGTTFTLFFPTLEHKEKQEESTPPKIINTTNHSTQLSPLEKLHQKADYTLQLNRPDAAILEPMQPNANSKNNSNKRTNLLIVEDEPDLRTYLVNSLSENYHVFSAADGQAGLDLVIKHKPDLVLLDLMLPKIDGLALCKKIKNEATLQFTKVVLLTARIDEQSKLTALENGADDFITKPFSTTELKTRLRNLADSLQLEKDLQIHNQELTQALANLKAAESKLLHSEKLNALGSLAAGLLHEVNNPLNYTMTAAQILKRDPTVKQDEDMAEMVDDIMEGMDRIKAIVKDLHTFAYPEEADKEQAFVLVNAVRSTLRFTASEKGNITIDVNIPDHLEVIGSNSHIVQVLINLVTNAIKAVRQKEGGTIIIATQLIPSSDEKDENNTKPRVLVSVRDNGVGIEEKDRSRIFEPFYTTRDVGEGLGMGLSICHTIIENHGGSMKVESEVGKFTEFSFDLGASE